MEQIEDIKSNYKSIDNKTEKQLYCLKAFNFNLDEKLKKEFKFEGDIEIDNQQNIQNSKTRYVTVTLGNESFLIEQKARIICFIINKKYYKRFIYSCKHLNEVIKELKIEYYSTTKDELDNSLEIEISEDKVYELFNQESITNIYKIEFDESKIKEIFNERLKINKDKISGLSINSKFYYPEDDRLDLSIFCNYKYTDNIFKFPWTSNENILYFIGPKGTSKSLFLLNFRTYCSGSGFPTVYINYKVLKNLNDKDRKYYFKNEIVYLFFYYEKFNDFYKSKYHRLINKENNNFIHNIMAFTQQLIDIFENYFDQKIILFIDNFNEKDVNLFNEMDKIINLVKKYPKKIKLIISGCSDFLKTKLQIFLKNRNFTDVIDRQALIIYDLKLQNKNEIKSLAAYNFRKDIKDEKLEETLVNEEIKYCEKFNIYGMNFSVINNKKDLNLETLLKYIPIIPFEYLNFSINEEGNSFKFEFFNPIFLNAVKKSIKAEIKEKSLSFLLENNNKDYIINGIYEEKLLTQIISNNKIQLKNLEIPENNLLEINKICELKDKKYEKTSQKIDISLPIIITQSFLFTPLYDLLVLVPERNNDKIDHIAYIIQIGTNEPDNKIKEIENDFEQNKGKYITGIKKLIDNNINIKKIELLFIFDKETQEKLIGNYEKANKCGVKYCIQKQIKFYCFSTKTYKLYKNLDNHSFTEIDEFGDFSMKKNWNTYVNERFSFLEKEEIDFINSKLEGDIINCWIFYQGPRKTLYIIDDKKIYILEKELNKYFVIKGEIYNKKFEVVKDEKIINNIKNKNQDYEIFVLDTCKNEEINIKKSK